jgi:hypothetical protein
MDIRTPLIYNQEKWHEYGVDSETGDLYSKKYGRWKKIATHVSGKSPYPKSVLNGKCIVQHIAVHETLNPVLPVPPGIANKDWIRTPKSVKKMLRHVWQVNHIDHCHTNSNPSNLEWTTQQQNVDAYHKHRVKNSG